MYIAIITPSFYIVSNNFLETEFEALNGKIFPFFTTHHFTNFHCFHLHPSSVGRNRYAIAIPEN